MTQHAEARDRVEAPLTTPTDLEADATRDLGGALTALLADVFALYLKTKNFHWHVSGPHFHDYHLMFDAQAGQLFAMTDPLAERSRKIGGMTLRSIGHVAKAFLKGAAGRTSASAGVCMMDESQGRLQLKPAGPVDRETRERALDQALDQSFPASDTPSMLRPHRKPAPDGAPPR